MDYPIESDIPWTVTNLIWDARGFGVARAKILHIIVKAAPFPYTGVLLCTNLAPIQEIIQNVLASSGEIW